MYQNLLEIFSYQSFYCSRKTVTRYAPGAIIKQQVDFDYEDDVHVVDGEHIVTMIIDVSEPA